MEKKIIFKNEDVKNPPKIIISDIDGTLLNSHHQVSDRTKRIIQDISLKVPFVYASGRCPQALIEMHQILLKKAPLIALNGTLILDENFRPLAQVPLAPHYVASLLNEFKKLVPHGAVDFYTAKNWYTTNSDFPGQIAEEKIVGFMAKQMPLPYPIDEEAVLKIIIIAGSHEIPEIYDYLTEVYPYLTILVSRDDMIEIYDQSASKGKALLHLLELYKLKPKDALAIGDSPLDYSLLEVAEKKAAMANSYDDLLALANIHLPNNDEDGAALLLEYYDKQM